MASHELSKLKFAAAMLAAVLAAGTLRADEPNLVLTVDGITYSNFTWGTVTPSSVSIIHKTGVARIPLELLPPDLKKRFGYDPEKARAYEESVRAAEAARQEALNKYQAALRDQRAKEDAERQVRARRAAELKETASAINPLNFVGVTNMVTLSPGMHEAVLLDDVGCGVVVRFDDNGRRFLETAAAEQERIASINEERRKQAEIARGSNYSGAVVVNSYYAEAVESPPLKYAVLDPKVFTVYAVPMGDSVFQLIGSRMTGQQGGPVSFSW